jgi:hypothetical protein
MSGKYFQRIFGGRPRKSDMTRGFENFGYVLLALPAGNLPSSLAILLKASGINMSGRPITARRNNEITSHTVEWTRTGQSS